MSRQGTASPFGSWEVPTSTRGGEHRSDGPDRWLSAFIKARPPRPFEQPTVQVSGRDQEDLALADRVPTFVPRRPAVSPMEAAERTQVVGRWWGWVTDVGDESFWAEVEDLRWKSPPHAVELPLDLVSDYDRELVREDAVFYWTIGYRRRSSGTRVQEAFVRFRRVPYRVEGLDEQASEWTERMRALGDVIED